MKESWLDKKLTINFTLKEFVVSRFYGESQERVIESFEKDSKAQENVEQLANELQTLRDCLNAPVSINIAYRPKWWEKKQGRSGSSQHVLGKAADIVVNGTSTTTVAGVIKRLIREGKIQDGGVGIYNSFVHYDIGPVGRRWKS